MEVLMPKARFLLEKGLEEHFKIKNGESLRTAVSNVLNDKGIFTSLAVYLPRGRGLELGELRLANDDADTSIFYGLTLDTDNIPRKTQLYFHEGITSLARNNNFRMTSGFPRSHDIRNYPTPLEFIDNVNRVLQEPNKYFSDISAFLIKKR